MTTSCYGRWFLISIIFYYLYITGLLPATYNLVPITTKRSLPTASHHKRLIWVYDIIDSSSLTAGSPFITKTDCANKLVVNRATVRSYLDADKLYDNKWLFSSTSLSEEQLSKWVIPDSVWETVMLRNRRNVRRCLHKIRPSYFWNKR